MITQPGSTNRYPIPTVGTSIANAPENNPRYSQNISAISNVKVVPVIRGFDGTTATTHNSDYKLLVKFQQERLVSILQDCMSLVPLWTYFLSARTSRVKTLMLPQEL